MDTMAFKSPPRKLIGFFRRSRDGWKEKYMKLKRSKRAVEGQLRAVERSRDSWKAQAKELRREVEELKNRIIAPPPRAKSL